MNIMYDKALSLWVSHDKTRPEFTRIFNYEGNVIATNLYALAYCDEAYIIEDFEPFAGKTKFSEVMIAPPYEENMELRLTDIIAALNACEQAEDMNCTDDTPCDDCQGDGVVEFEYVSKKGRTYEKEIECPVCNGDGIKGRYYKTGKMKPVDYATIQIGKRFFGASMLGLVVKTMETLDVLAINILNPSAESGQMLLKANDLYIIIMPKMESDSGKYPDVPIHNTNHTPEQLPVA
jgi:hypothetical protein